MIVSRVEGPADAETVVFVHGAGVAGWMWDEQVRALDGWRRVVVDLPDHGLARAQPFTTIEAAADALAELVAARVPEGRAHLVGHSLGARVVLECLVRHPGRARSAVVSSALLRPSPLVAWLNQRALVATSLWMLRSPWVARLQARQLRFPAGEMTEAFLAELRQADADNLLRPVAAFSRRLALPPGLDAVTCPVLVTVGAREVGPMLASAEDLVAALPDARRDVLPEADHTYPWHQHERYTALLARWLRAPGRGSAS